MVHIVTFANREADGLHNWLTSMKKFGYEASVIGMGTPWKGWMTRTRAYYDYISKLSSERLIVLIDAFDALACRSAPGLIETYIQFKRPLVVSTETVCLKLLNCRPVTQWWQHHNLIPGRYQYINAGVIMGTREALMEALAYILESGLEDDQLGLCQYIEAHPDKVALDTDSRLIGTITSKSRHDFNDQLIRKDTGTQPYFVHIPGIRGDFGRRYNTIGSKLLGTQFKHYKAIPDILQNKDYQFWLGCVFWLILILTIIWPKVGLGLVLILLIYVLFILYV